MRGTTLKRALTNAFALVFVAVGLPAFLELGLLSASVVMPLASLSIFLVSDLAADSFSGPLNGMDRRRFLLASGGALGALALAGCDSMGPKAAQPLLKFAER